jgi:hypothetical protein
LIREFFDRMANVFRGMEDVVDGNQKYSEKCKKIISTFKSSFLPHLFLIFQLFSVLPSIFTILNPKSTTIS